MKIKKGQNQLKILESNFTLVFHFQNAKLLNDFEAFFKQRCFKSSRYGIIDLLKITANKGFSFASCHNDNN